MDERQLGALPPDEDWVRSVREFVARQAAASTDPDTAPVREPDTAPPAPVQEPPASDEPSTDRPGRVELR